MISFVLRAWSIVLVAVKRLFAERGLAFAAILGLVGNILSDFAYVLIDPRINFQQN